METLNAVLIGLADAVLWCWHGAVSLAILVGHGCDVVVEPILSPLLAFVNPISTSIVDGVFAALAPFPVWAGLTMLSVLAGLLSLGVFRLCSNQIAISRALDDIKANLLALKLYKDELRVTFLCQYRIAGAIARLQWHMFRPVAVMLIPMLPLLGQLGVRYQWRPLHPGEQAQIVMVVDESAEGREIGALAVTLEDHAAITVETPAVPGDGKLVWRIRVDKTGRHVLKFHVGDVVVEKELVVSEGFARVSPTRTKPDWTTQLLQPVERTLPRTGVIRSIRIAYPAVDSWVYGSDFWIVHLFAVSMLTALVFRPVFGVRF